jgi:hypothetical protein
MKGDLLREATRSLREATESPDSSAAFTRMRVMNSLHRARRRRATRVVLWIPLAAVLVGASAVAATGHLPTLWVRLGRAVGLTTNGTVLNSTQGPKTHSANLKRAGRSDPRVLSDPAAPPLPAVQVKDKVEPSEPAGKDQPAVSADGRKASRVGPAKRVRVMTNLKSGGDRGQGGAALPAGVGDVGAELGQQDAEAAAELALYREAHRAHFDRHDCRAAVVGWERYLAEAPRGRFTLEARYNRALCLVRIGRHREAAAALTPFAEGAFGDYRRADARALLDALEAEDGGAR